MFPFFLKKNSFFFARVTEYDSLPIQYNIAAEAKLLARSGAGSKPGHGDCVL